MVPPLRDPDREDDPGRGDGLRRGLRGVRPGLRCLLPRASFLAPLATFSYSVRFVLFSHSALSTEHDLALPSQLSREIRVLSLHPAAGRLDGDRLRRGIRGVRPGLRCADALQRDERRFEKHSRTELVCMGVRFPSRGWKVRRIVKNSEKTVVFNGEGGESTDLVDFGRDFGIAVRCQYRKGEATAACGQCTKAGI